MLRLVVRLVLRLNADDGTALVVQQAADLFGDLAVQYGVQFQMPGRRCVGSPVSP